MENFGSEIGQKMRSAVKAKLLELGTGGSAGYIDDELPDYVMIMVANKRSKQQMITDLNLFLGTQTELFVTWLHEVLQKLQEVTLPAASASSRKRKSILRDEPTTVASSSTTGSKKDRKAIKKDKKSAPAKKIDNGTSEEHQTPTTTTGVNSSVPVINSITDVFAEDFLEKAKKTLDVNADAIASIKKGKGKRVTTESLPPSTAAEVTQRGNTTTSEFDIPTMSEISSTTEAVPSGNREKDLAELAEIQKKIYAAKKQLKNLENYDDAESEDEDFLNLKDDGSAEEFDEAGDLVKKKSRRAKSPIVFDHKETNKAVSTEQQREQQNLQEKRRRITPPPAQTLANTPAITALSIDNRRAASTPSRNLRDDLQPRLSRERERREPLTPHPKRSVHDRLGSKPQQHQQTLREDSTRERRSRQEKELYVPAFRRREIEIERKRERERGGREERDRDRDRDRERERDRSSIRRRSSPEQQPILSSSSVAIANGPQRSQVVQMVTSTNVRRKRGDSSGAVASGADVAVAEEEPRVQRQRIGSRVIVAATKQPEPSDDEDLIEKPVNSVIKIKPRPPVSPSKQACKNLLLRAVAEAQRSTILTQLKPTESVTKVTVRLGEAGVINERSTKLYTKSYRDRLKRGAVAASSMLFRRTRQNLVIEVEGEGRINSLDNKRRRRNSEDRMEEEEYMPEPASDHGDSDGDYVYVPQMTNESGDEPDTAIGSYHINEAEYEEDCDSSNDLDDEKTQFVVTLNDDKPPPGYKHARNARSHSPPPLVSSSSASRNNVVEPSSTTTRNKRSRSREPRRGDIKSRLQLKAKSSLSPLTNARLGERESTNSSQSCNTPPPPRRSELIEIYRKPKEIKKIIIKNDSEDDDSPIKSVKHDKHENRSKLSHKRRSHDEPIIERSLTPPMPPKKQRHSVGGSETKLTTTTSPVRSPIKRKRTPIKFDLSSLDSRNLAREHNNATATKSRSRSYERGSSIERRSGDEYHHTRQKISIRNSEAKKYENIPSLSSVAIDSTIIKVNKPKERCKYHPNCTKHNCDYYHPTAPCKSFPNCKFADKCMYSHPKCKFDMACTNIDCNYSHSGIRNPSQLQSQAPPLSSHVVPVQNYKSISAAPAASSTMCKYYPNCSKLGCTFYHPKPCRFGKNCINKLECNFYHHELQSSSKFKWVASAV